MVEEDDSYYNDVSIIYESPENFIPLKSIHVDRGQEAECTPQNSTEPKPSAYTPLKNNEEPDSFYQPLQFPDTKIEGEQRD